MAAQRECVEWRDRWPKVVAGRQTAEAIDLLQRYYASLDGRPWYTGARFEAVAALNNDPNTLGPADFVAVSMLSVDIRPEAAIRLLGPDSATITQLLQQIPTDLDIVDADPGVLDSESAAGKLWEVLRQGGDGIGRTRTSKLIAAKRPRLIPIWDSFVEQATGLATPDYWWRFKQVLVADDRAIWNWLGELRPRATNVPQGVSELRMLDVLLWMTVEGSGGTQPPRV